MPKHTSPSLAVVFLLVAVVCARLGTWQLARLHQRRAANATALAKRALPVVALGSATSPPLSDTTLAGRRVAAVGHYDSERELVLRGRAFEGVPGVDVVTPLMLEGRDTAILVDRGFVPAPDAATAPPPDSSRTRGIVRVEGLALPPETGQGRPIQHDGRTTWARIDLDAIRARLPYPIAGIYIRRTLSDSAANGPARDSAAEFPHALPAPTLDDGPHLSYALQWFAFTTLAVVFAGVVGWKRG